MQTKAAANCYIGMSTIALVFPHQLFLQHPALSQVKTVCIVEEELYFNQFSFHKKKLVLHRASMKYYEQYLLRTGYTVHYVEAGAKESAVTFLVQHLHQKKFKKILYADTADYWIEKRLQAAAKKNNCALIKFRNPNFLNTVEETDAFFEKQKKYFQTDFYIHQRRQRNILLEKDGGPVGGKWSFDADNRQRIPKGLPLPQINLPDNKKYLPEAIAYVQKNFPHNYGNTTPPFFKRQGFYPVTHDEAEAWLDDFLKNRFASFGVYEDAMVAEQGYLFHSVLTPMLNIGLLQPKQIIDKAIEVSINYDIPINSLEGFIRQIMGWREFIHLIYQREGRKQRSKNYWQFSRKIPEQFWNGTTGILPVDTVIQKLLQNGYSHHIERLMVMGNFMLLCEFHPHDVYQWFMELYVDAYDWVMVPNVYGMTQFADGGLMTTKPYISGSNYLMKMGNWQKGEWQEIWDGLFWRFMHTHRKFFLQNPRLGMLVSTFDKMPAQKQQKHLSNAQNFLDRLDAWNKK